MMVTEALEQSKELDLEGDFLKTGHKKKRGTEQGFIHTAVLLITSAEY